MNEELRKYIDEAAANFATVQGPGMPPGLGSLTKAFVRGAEIVVDYEKQKNADFEQKTQKIEQKMRFFAQKVEKFEQFRALVSEVREAQKEYFRTRSGEVLRRSKALERRLDEELKSGLDSQPDGDCQLSIFGEGGQ
jgi:hypothetical protein